MVKASRRGAVMGWWVWAGLLLLGAAGAAGAEVVEWAGEGVPAPQPVAGSVKVGAYIFPGWYRDTGRGDYPYRTHDEDSEWRLVAKVPKPRPTLGFYDDSLPEVNDWHIKWALEHGISYFCFDWYWNAGEHRLLRTLEEGFLKARYCDQMQFCIHWCNHGLDWKDRSGSAPGGLSLGRAELVEMTEYMAEHYFSRPNYLTVEGRPVFVVWDTRALIAANGGPEGFARALEAMNEVLRARGLGDLYLVAVGDFKENAAAGFSARTDYGYYGVATGSEYEFRGGRSLPYEETMEFHQERWEGITSQPALPYILSLGSNWDNRPRAGDGAAVITGKTPAKFETLCGSARPYVDGRTNMVLVEAWNEWGEGSFIEPDREFGFGMLDAIRATFTQAPAEHTDLVPAPERVAAYSVLQGQELADAAAAESHPYPDPPLQPCTVRLEVDGPVPAGPVLRSWEFEGATSEGWINYQLEAPTVAGGVLATTALGDDPQLIVDNVGVEVEQLDCLALRVKAAEGAGSAEVFFTTTTEPAMTADKVMRFVLRPDGQWHTYLIRKQVEDKWSGTLKILRLDIGGMGERLEVDWVRLVGRG